MNIVKVLESSNVSRFHAVTGMTPQTIALHSWGVALLCQHFWPDCSKNLILAALTHDCAELITGDIPGTAKWANPELKVLLDSIEADIEKEWKIDYNLDLVEKRMLKLCDCLEGMNYCLERRKHGELEASVVFGRWSSYISDNFSLNTSQRDFFNGLCNQMGAINNGRQ